MATVIDELVTLLTFDADASASSDIREYRDAISELGQQAAEASGKIASFATSLVKHLHTAAGDYSSMYEWARANGVAADSFQRLGYVAEQFGGDMDSMKQDMAAFALQAQAQGITLEQLFMDLSASVQGLDEAQQHAALSGIVSSEELIRAMQAGPEEMRRMLSEASVMAESDMRASLEYTREWRRIVSQVNAVLRQAMSSVMPVLSKAMASLGEILQGGRGAMLNAMVGYFGALVDVLSRLAWVVFNVAGRLAQFLTWLDKATGGISSYVVVMGLAWTATAAWAALTIGRGVLAVKALISILPGAIASVKALAAAMHAANLAFLANPWVLGTIAAIAVVAALIYEWKKLFELSRVIFRLWMDLFGFLGRSLRPVPGMVRVVAKRAWQGARDALASAMDGLGDVVGNVLERAEALLSRIGAVFLGLARLFTLDSILAALDRVFNQAMRWMDSFVSRVNAVRNSVTRLRDELRALKSDFFSPLEKAQRLVSGTLALQAPRLMQAGRPGLAVPVTLPRRERPSVQNVSNDSRKWNIVNNNTFNEVQDVKGVARSIGGLPDMLRAGFGRTK